VCDVVVILVVAGAVSAPLSFISLRGCAVGGWVTVVSIGIDPDEHSHITHAHDLFGVAAMLPSYGTEADRNWIGPDTSSSLRNSTDKMHADYFSLHL
jgi:hypothetical protein